MTIETLNQQPQLDKAVQDYLNQLVAEQVEKAVAAKLAALTLPKTVARKDQTRKVAIVVTKGTLDMAYPPLILATSAAAVGAEVVVFCTLYGVNLLCKDKNTALQVAPVGNPAMPISVPNIIGMLPGMTSMATRIMKGMISKNQVKTVPELLKEAQELKVRLIACELAMNVMGIKKEELMEGIEIGQPDTFLNFAFDAPVTLLI